ncbi:MAG: DUF885 domain-containing protein, partial [Streptomycetaceae bacterium]|nr:DUF885 domain-containing protein [Streptomycetaceae bacterium]
MDDRLRAICALSMAEAREGAGLHEYDGMVQDLSPSGVRAAVERIGTGSDTPYADPHDEAHVTAFEAHTRLVYGDLQLHRSDPRPHLYTLELAFYDTEYAPAEERAAARA